MPATVPWFSHLVQPPNQQISTFGSADAPARRVVIEGGLGGVLLSSESWVVEGPASSEGWVEGSPAGVEGFLSCSVGIMSVQSGTSSSGSAGSMASNDISLVSS